MNRTIMAGTVVSILAIGVAAFLGVAGGNGSFCSRIASTFDPSASQTASKAATGAESSGKVLGHFDLAMAGCRFACGTDSEYDSESVLAQPGVRDGELTQCPVSGVGFSVDAQRPHVQVGADDYVTCCDTCAEKLRENPRRFVRV
jgi:hypothetical protein